MLVYRARAKRQSSSADDDLSTTLYAGLLPSEHQGTLLGRVRVHCNYIFQVTFI